MFQRKRNRTTLSGLRCDDKVFIELLEFLVIIYLQQIGNVYHLGSQWMLDSVAIQIIQWPGKSQGDALNQLLFSEDLQAEAQA